MNKRVAAALAAVLGATSPGVWADVSASVRLTAFGYHLIDLNPGDGIAPALSFDLSQFDAEIGVRAQERVPSEEPGGPGQEVLRMREWSRSQEFFPNIGRAVETPNAQASAGLSGSLAGHDLRAVVEGQVRNPLANPQLAGYFYADAEPAWLAPGGMGRAITVTPFTQVIWSGQLALEAANTLPMHKGGFEQASAYVQMHLVGYGDGQADSFVALVETPRYRVGQASELHDLRLTYTNDSAAPGYTYFISQMRATGYSFLPVPEPGTPWLMLGGLGLIGALCRRERREARHAR